MKIIDDKYRPYDIETIKSYFLFCAVNPNTGEFTDFSINQYQNDLYSFIKYLESNKDKIWIGYNNLSFDGPIVEYIWRNYSEWYDLSGLEIANLIWQESQENIENSNYGGFPKYKNLTFSQLDCLKIQHFDNKNRMVGLKRLEYEMDMDDIREMPTPHDQMSFTPEEVELMIKYCHHDVTATLLNFRYLIGDTNHELYKGSDQIAVREALTETFGFDCTNYSNSKYGDEIIKTLYCKEAGIDYNDLPKKGTFRKNIYFKHGIPDYVEFNSSEFSSFFKSIKNKVMGAMDEFEQDIKFKEQIYTFALGGLHNKISNKMYDSDDEYIIIDADVTSYYVATILNNEYSPAHLNKKAFINSYRWVYNERVKLKPLGKTDNKIKGVVSGYKEAGVSVYGKSRDNTNWLYDPQMGLSTCIAGELSIMMLIEDQELAGTPCIMANTDGAAFYVKRKELDKFYDICEKWCKKTMYQLEYFEFEKLYFRDINNYIGKKVDGEIKRKGKFLIDTELHKNKSFRVIPLALSEYFINGTDPEVYINKFNDIKQFGARSSAGASYAGHTIISKTGEQKKTSKLIRYYVAKDGERIMKIAKPDNEKKTRNSNLNPAEKPKFICNYLPEEDYNTHLSNIDKEWYIDQVKELIYLIEIGKKPKKVTVDKNQMSLF